MVLKPPWFHLLSLNTINESGSVIDYNLGMHYSTTRPIYKTLFYSKKKKYIYIYIYSSLLTFNLWYWIIKKTKSHIQYICIFINSMTLICHLYFESFASILPLTVLKSELFLFDFLLRDFLDVRDFRCFCLPRDPSGFCRILSKRWRRISGSAQPFPHSVKVE